MADDDPQFLLGSIIPAYSLSKGTEHSSHEACRIDAKQCAAHLTCPSPWRPHNSPLVRPTNSRKKTSKKCYG